jgi:type II secretory pathway predicted ATPase ExeA
MLYGIRERKGFVQLTGEVGAGKTTLCRALLEQLDGALFHGADFEPGAERG